MVWVGTLSAFESTHPSGRLRFWLCTVRVPVQLSNLRHFALYGNLPTQGRPMIHVQLAAQRNLSLKQPLNHDMRGMLEY